MAEKKRKLVTVVKGIRANAHFFDLLDQVAKIKNISRNELINTVMSNYCEYQIYLYNKLTNSIDK